MPFTFHCPRRSIFVPSCCLLRSCSDTLANSTGCSLLWTRHQKKNNRCFGNGHPFHRGQHYLWLLAVNFIVVIPVQTMLGKFNLWNGSRGPCESSLSMKMTSWAVRAFKRLCTEAAMEQTDLKLVHWQIFGERKIPPCKTSSCCLPLKRCFTNESTSSLLINDSQTQNQLCWEVLHLRTHQLTENFCTVPCYCVINTRTSMSQFLAFIFFHNTTLTLFPQLHASFSISGSFVCISKSLRL